MALSTPIGTFRGIYTKFEKSHRILGLYYNSGNNNGTIQNNGNGAPTSSRRWKATLVASKAVEAPAASASPSASACPSSSGPPSSSSAKVSVSPPSQPTISSVIIPNSKSNTRTKKLITNQQTSPYSDSSKTSASPIPKTSDLLGQDQPMANVLRKAYEDAKAFCKSKKLPEDVDQTAVFSCNRLNLGSIDVYGWDYDYTLACYRPELEQLIYHLGMEKLLSTFKYPKGIESLQYNPHFAVRGLHYDIHNGLLLKVDSFTQVQLGCVYRGLTKLSDEEVLQIYGSSKIPMKFIDEGPMQRNQDAKMTQLSDLFSLPEMNLLCNVTEYFNKNNIEFTPESLFRDVRESIQSIHPVMHQIVSSDPQKYLEYDPRFREYFTRLRSNGKKNFLITNSPYHFVDKGLSYILGEDWLDFFDVTVVSARKPYFFSNDHAPFRVYDPDVDARSWDRVTSLEPHKIYYGGNVTQFQSLTGWKGDKVLYFGDHPYSDLADATLHHGWRTGAIIREISKEIETLNRPDFKYAMNWVNFMTSLLETYQDVEDDEAQAIIRLWQRERKSIRTKNKEIFNPQFGSMFRTHLNPTFFSKRLFRFADIYTSSVTNLMKYSDNHTFYPRRGALPHEYRSWFN